MHDPFIFVWKELKGKDRNMAKVCASAVVCFIINGQHLKEQATTQTWTFRCRILSKGVFFFSSLFFFPPSFFHQDLPFLFAAPLCAPHPPSCPHYRELGPGHWPWTLTPPVISHIPGPFPPLRPKTAHRSSPPPLPTSSPVLSLSPCFFPPFPLAGSRMAMLAFDGVLL